MAIKLDILEQSVVRRFALVVSLAWSTALMSQGATEGQVLPPPELPRPMQSGEAISPEPEVTIRNEKDRTIEEYRVEGKLYMIKIAPAKGQPYYLVDYDGDGLMESELESPYGQDIVVPQWVIFSW